MGKGKEKSIQHMNRGKGAEKLDKKTVTFVSM
jgi:hypothetical protein